MSTESLNPNSAISPTSSAQPNTVTDVPRLGRPSVVALTFFALVCVLLKLTNGSYNPIVLLALVVGFIGFAWRGYATTAGHVRMNKRDTDGAEVPIQWLVAFMSLVIWISPGLIYARPGVWTDAITPISAVVLTGSALLIASSKRLIPSGIGLCAAVVIAVGAIALQVVTIFASPTPFIDVWGVTNLGSDILLAGGNPYQHVFPNIYKDAVSPELFAARYDYAMRFFYWPGYLLAAAPFRALFGDVRAAHIFANCFAAVLLYDSTRRLGRSVAVSRALTLLWLVNPVSLFVVEQSWIDPVLMLGIAGVFNLLVRKQWLAAGLVLGWVVCIKQYAALVALMIGFWLLGMWRARGDGRPLLLVVGASVCVAMLILGPFLIWDASAFYSSTIQPLEQLPVLHDALSLNAWAHNMLHVRIPDSYVIVTVLLCWSGIGYWVSCGDQDEMSRMTFAICLGYGIFFLTGKTANTNYYHLVTFCVALHTATLLPTSTTISNDLASSS